MFLHNYIHLMLSKALVNLTEGICPFCFLNVAHSQQTFNNSVCPTLHRCAGMEVNKARPPPPRGSHANGRWTGEEREEPGIPAPETRVRGCKRRHREQESVRKAGREQGSMGSFGLNLETSRSQDRAAGAAGARGKALCGGRMSYVWGTACRSFTGLEHGAQGQGRGQERGNPDTDVTQVSHTDTWLQSSDSPALLPL